MRALLQRVSSASVSVEGTVIGQIGPGLLILVCAMQGDSAANARQLASKVARLRLFQDAAGKMNLDLAAVGGAALVISQFTLAADTSRGNRPGYSAAAAPELAEPLYLAFAERLREAGIPVETGQFGAAMQVSLVNDGPVTIWIER